MFGLVGQQFEKRVKGGKNHFGPAGDRVVQPMSSCNDIKLPKTSLLTSPQYDRKCGQFLHHLLEIKVRIVIIEKQYFYYNTIDKLEPNILCMYIVQLIHQITISICGRSYFNIVMLRQNTDPTVKIFKRTSSFLRTVQGPCFLFSAYSLSQKCVVDLQQNSVLRRYGIVQTESMRDRRTLVMQQALIRCFYYSLNHGGM